MARLSASTLAMLAASPIVVPAYERERAGIGIVHLGIGAFHRAHQAVYTDDALAQGTGDWSICGVSLRAADVRDSLSPQDGLYTAVEKSPAGVRRRVIGSVREVLFLGDQRQRVAARLASADTRIVSLTVTEKGYCHDPATGMLNFDHPDIVHDLQQPDSPRSAVGLLASALDARKRDHGRGFTILCCDNLPHNGALLRGLTLAFAAARDGGLERWIDANVSFPSTMVDRIVPATTADDITANNAALDLDDAAPVMHEPFGQWAIEDRFLAGRPGWDCAGAQFVADVAPFEAMKLRLLNASHSAFAYLGFLAGHEFIFQVAAQPAFVAYMRAMMADEIAPSLRVPNGVDLEAYQHALVDRFKNPALPHRTQQIAMDGSQKLPQRMLATVRENLAAGRPIDHLALAVAGWMRYVSGVDEQRRAIKVADPMSADFARIAAAASGDPAALASGLLGLRAIFGEDLAGDVRFSAKVTDKLAALYRDGAARTVARTVAAPS